MEWYWVVVMILAFFAVAGVFVWLGKSGKLGKHVMTTLVTVVDALSTIMDAVAGLTPNPVLDGFKLAMTLVEKAVKAAENAYYNGEITADQRRELCMKEFDALMAAAGVTLTDAQRDVIDTLIRAACEELGHQRVQKAALMAQN